MATLLDVATALSIFQILVLCGLLAAFTGFGILYFETVSYPLNLPRVCEPVGATRLH
jgi:hypothetical protein